jgi:hypothetical protein
MYVTVDGSATDTLRVLDYGKWLWLKARPTYDLAPGEHVLRARTCEAGMQLDRVVITNDTSYDPRGSS